MNLRAFMGLLDPKTQKATGFYLLLGLVCSDIWHKGLGKYNFGALVLMAGLGSLSGLAQLIHGPSKTSTNPPGGDDVG